MRANDRSRRVSMRVSERAAGALKTVIGISSLIQNSFAKRAERGFEQAAGARSMAAATLSSARKTAHQKSVARIFARRINALQSMRWFASASRREKIAAAKAARGAAAERVGSIHALPPKRIERAPLRLRACCPARRACRPLRADCRAQILFRNRRARTCEGLTKNVGEPARDARKKIGKARRDRIENRARNRRDEHDFEEALCALGAFAAKKSKRMCV